MPTPMIRDLLYPQPYVSLCTPHRSLELPQPIITAVYPSASPSESLFAYTAPPGLRPPEPADPHREAEPSLLPDEARPPGRGCLAVPAQHAIQSGIVKTTNITEEHRQVAKRYEGRNVLGRLWIELRQ